MKAVVFRGIGDIRLEQVAEPRLEKSSDAIVRLTASAICGTDLHFIRGTLRRPTSEPNWQTSNMETLSRSSVVALSVNS